MAFSLTNTASAQDLTDGTSFTFSTQSLGAEPSGGETRTIVVTVQAQGSSTSCSFSSATVAGNSLTQISSLKDNLVVQYIGRVEIASGTTGDVVVNFTGANAAGCAIGVFRLIDADIAGSETLTEDTTHSSGVLNLDVNVPATGGVIAVSSGVNNGLTTWSPNAANELWDVDVGSGNDVMSGWIDTSSSGTPLTITATNNDTTPLYLIGASVSWDEAAAGGGAGVDVPIFGTRTGGGLYGRRDRSTSLRVKV